MQNEFHVGSYEHSTANCRDSAASSKSVVGPLLNSDAVKSTFYARLGEWRSCNMIAKLRSVCPSAVGCIWHVMHNGWLSNHIVTCVSRYWGVVAREGLFLYLYASFTRRCGVIFPNSSSTKLRPVGRICAWSARSVTYDLWLLSFKLVSR